jgi:DNA-binding NtrC family response regulator
MKSNIMFVDDSIGVLESLRWIFMDEPYHLFPFVNPLKALNAIDFKEFAVVVTDQSMPEMTGIEFLEKVKQRSPDTEGIIMCGFVEPQTVSSAINQGVVSRFIEKPLDINEIKQAVALALTRYRINVESRRETMSILKPRDAFSLKQ